MHERAVGLPYASASLTRDRVAEATAGTDEPIDDWPSQWIVVALDDAHVFDARTKSMRFAEAGDDTLTDDVELRPNRLE